MSKVAALDELWNSTPSPTEIFDSRHLTGLPEAARRYLTHAITPSIQLALAVRLRMHGAIKLKRWFPFTAEQVIRSDQGMIWRATVRMRGVPIRGFDRLLNGAGEMQWKLLGLVPLMTAANPDITRSAAGRLAAETVWLPSGFCREDVTWTTPDSSHARASFMVEGERVAVELAIDGVGRLGSLTLKRWGNPGGAEYHYVDFGGVVESEGAFDGYTIPTRLRAGWYFGTERFESEGEFFRARIDRADFR